MGALLIKVFENNRIYTFIESFFNGQPMSCFKFFLRYMLLKFVFLVFRKIRIPWLMSIIKMSLNEGYIVSNADLVLKFNFSNVKP